YVWALGGREGEVPPLPRHTLIKIDVERRSAVVFDRCPDLLGEPVFAPRPRAVDEDDGWILCRAHVPERGDNELLVLDARSMKLVARVRLPRGLPPGLHGSWVPAPLPASAGVAATCPYAGGALPAAAPDARDLPLPPGGRGLPVLGETIEFLADF